MELDIPSIFGESNGDFNADEWKDDKVTDEWDEEDYDEMWKVEEEFEDWKTEEEDYYYAGEENENEKYGNVEWTDDWTDEKELEYSEDTNKESVLDFGAKEVEDKEDDYKLGIYNNNFDRTTSAPEAPNNGYMLDNESTSSEEWWNDDNEGSSVAGPLFIAAIIGIGLAVAWKKNRSARPDPRTQYRPIPKTR